MNKTEGLRAGVAEMRSVAQRLMAWADDLEASFRPPETDEGKVPASEPAPVEKEKGAPKETAKENAGALTLPEVRAILAEKVAAGFGTQVKALIESYGTASLKGVPADRYGELLEAVKGIGESDAG